MSRPPAPPADWAVGVAAGVLTAIVGSTIVWAIGITLISLRWWHAPLLWLAASGTWLSAHAPMALHKLGLPWTIAPVAPISQWPAGLDTQIGWATGSALAIGGVTGLVAGIWAAEVPAEQRVGGRYLVNSPHRYARRLRRRERADGVRIHAQIPLARDRERRHLLAIGGTGSGKTQVLHRLISGSIPRGDQQLIFDYKGDLTSQYYDPATTLIAPWDGRSAAWDIAADVPDLAAARELAAALIPLPRSGDPKWANGARQILTGLIVALQQQSYTWTVADLSRVASADGETIAATLRQHFPEAAALLTNPTTNPATSYLASLIDYLAPIHDLARLTSTEPDDTRPRWSVRRWLDGDASPRVIVGHDQGQADLSRFMIAALLRLVLQRVGSADFDKPAAPTWLFLDEFIQAGQIESLVNIAEVARAKDIRLVLACQSIERLREVYGRDAADGLAGGVGTLVIGRCRGETARWASEQVGAQQLERYRASVGDNGGTRHWDRVSEPVMRPEAFDADLGTRGRGRRVSNRLLLLAGGNAVAQLDWPLWILRAIAPAHVPRTDSRGSNASMSGGATANPDASLSPAGAPAQSDGESPAEATGATERAASTRATRLARLKAASRAQADGADAGPE